MLVRQAISSLDLDNILLLQQKNAKTTLSASEIKQEGFVTVQHSKTQLEQMQSLVPQIIAEEKGELIGYALVMPRELKSSIPVLIPMFDLLDSLTYKGEALKELSFYVMGQICVAKAYREQGVFQELYHTHKRLLSAKYDYCITEVSTSNLRSMKAHLRMGFEVLHCFTDAEDEWNIVLWDWTK